MTASDRSSLPEFETTFAVPLSCEACIKDVSASLHKLPGISHISASLQDQLISITGNAAPSAIVRAIEDTGRDAILRGSGRAESAAVCILETHSSKVPLGEVVRGLIRMVEVTPKGAGEKDALVLADMTLKGVSEGTYHVSVRETGDISQGPKSVGGVWGLLETKEEEGGKEQAKGVFGTIQVGKSGLGSVFIDRPVRIWEMIGRSMVVSKQKAGEEDKEDPDTLVGVIARSAGVWDNDKTVCSCSGKTVWEERKEQRGKGMLLTGQLDGSAIATPIKQYDNADSCPPSRLKQVVKHTSSNKDAMIEKPFRVLSVEAVLMTFGSTGSSKGRQLGEPGSKNGIFLDTLVLWC